MPLYLNGTEGVSGINGTNATPAVRGTDTNTNFVFGTDIIQVIEGGSESARFDASGNLLVGVTTANANGGVLQLKSGITFPATQVTSTDVNTLDDYEEGDWTPRIDGNTTAGTGTYTAQKGTYVRIGSLVMAKGYVTWSAHTGTGFMRVAGLPFSSSSTANTFSSGTIYMDAATTITAGAVLQMYLGTSSASTVTAFYTSGGASVATTTMSNSGGFMVNIVYTV